MYKVFIRVQAYINRELIKQACITYDNPTSCHGMFDNDHETGILINRMPFPAYPNEIHGYRAMFYSLSCFLPLSFVLVILVIVKQITDEKSSRAKELLRLFGMSDGVFYAGHFLNYFIVILIQCIAITYIIFCCFTTPIAASSSMAMFCIGLILWAIQLIMFTMACSTLFNR